MELSGDETTCGDVTKDIVDSPCGVTVDEFDNLVQDLIWDLIEGRSMVQLWRRGRSQ
jgi:hypothetical protein